MAIGGTSEHHGGSIRLGMVGGGEGAFIGAVHRIAARLDGDYELVAGAFSSDAERSKRSGAALGLAEDRCYGTFEEMARREKRLKDGVEAVAIVTPNHMHFPVAKAFLDRGIHVICDKPLTTNLRDAKRLKAIAEKSGAIFALTHNYSAYPMIREARARVAAGELGDLRLVQVEYAQDWLAEDVHSKQADWRVDPAKAGAGGCIGDIGTHAYQLARFVTGLEVESLAADLTSFVPGRQVDDNVQVMLRFAGGAKGALWASQVAVGNENALRLRVYGTKAGIEWEQENPNALWFMPFGEPRLLLTRGGAGTGEAAARVTRVPAGHPEGYLEGFATIYQEVARAIRAARDGEPLAPDIMFPGVDDGVDGIAFIEAAVKSSKRNGAWTGL
ncbi:Gfo/Idh/MocA family protein [Consotaella salsifontis]|uniref:Predicted dehydrogenase n=1 Tax=Consotaella salsifontis TaxID=1365950 RepID=A0A1T4PA89_9HYPH|nr:Gfo/Idh/MocA family oxidoreductase [Consotaella salsifontis]SJZ88156.1 Predicted dehydrogenase [Consotaella salsifontis]